MKPAYSFRAPFWNSRKFYFMVHVFESRKKMYEYVQNGPNPQKGLGRQYVGLCRMFGDSDKINGNGHVGEILYVFGHLGTGTITHECCHAMFAVVKAHPELLGEMVKSLSMHYASGSRKIALVSDIEEVACVIIDGLCRAVVGKMHDLGVFEADERCKEAQKKNEKRGLSRGKRKRSQSAPRRGPSADGRGSVRFVPAKTTGN